MESITMSFVDFSRNQIRKLLTKENNIILENKAPSYESLERKFQDISEFGLYLHVPFCKQICPYCPYNKEIYQLEVAEMYTRAVKKEIDFYSALFGDKPVTSFYIGGGTPTTMLYSGLDEILKHIFRSFRLQCEIHMERHPNDLSLDNLNTIKSFHIEQAGHEFVEMGVDQVAAYPLFLFPYTEMGAFAKQSNYNILNVFKRRNMLHILEDIFYDNKFERTSVWAFTREGIHKYCSVTVPLYVGLGASGGSYLKDIFYLNTFNVAEYI